ncbi:MULTISPECIES: hypothetical protein [unclassified Blastococcus]
MPQHRAPSTSTTSSSPAPGGLPASAAERPLSPLFTASIDPLQGTIALRGRLDGLGADALRASVLRLRDVGHRCIDVRLRPGASLDADARDLLDELAGHLATEGVLLTVR